MRKTELDRYRRRLLDLRARLTGDLSSVLTAGLSGEKKDSGRTGGDEADLGNDHWDAELALSLSQNSKDTLDLIEGALKRIDDGTYGVCVGTGQKIAKARLDAIPYTPYCVEYAAQVERNGG
ncbi:MAG: TraR/DksA family transcriptional regulator [Planctomycetaceae bacterium]|nr:TraR/DksA family transcriptional regulator [Planctomycetaceae bacterium]